ncbi:hypothetical protein SSX86_001759 [Deinandra increscens subsp. villosa]|uniref:Harbinger transposase-derived protein n=1 Tax=Deinandra increscens subsp. villosa TaxID=3103831 RepID=A0AAP0HB41_9ASTR
MPPILPPELMTSSSSSSDSDTEALMFMKTCYEAIILQEEGDTARSKRRRSIRRDREAGHERLVELYFADHPRFNEGIFKDRFRMSRRLFLKIVSDIEQNFEWFQLRQDARGRTSFSPLQKCTVAIRQLATGNVYDEYDETFSMSERTTRECLINFCDAILKLYKDEFLHSPTSHDIERLYEAHGQYHGLPGMIGSIDCTHWEWRNCPREYHGQYHRGDHANPTIILEAVASQDMWFWHAFFGAPGANNDINVLNQSPLFANELHSVAPRCPFVVNARQYKIVV